MTQASKAITMQELQATARLHEGVIGNDATQLATLDDICWVALESVNGRRFLDQLELPTDAMQSMMAIKTWYNTKTGPMQKIALYILCRQQYIGIGCLETTPRNLEASQKIYHETQFKSITKDERFTRGYRRPCSLADQASCFECLPSSRVRRTNDSGSLRYCHVIFVGQELNKSRLAFFFVLWAVMAILVGVGAGVGSGKVTVGLALGGGVLAFVGILQGACVFAHR